MEQRLNATYLRPGVIERAAAIGIAAASIGTGVLLAAWGISFLWRYTPPEITLRQDKPFEIAPPAPLKIDPNTTLKVEAPVPLPDSRSGPDGKTPEGDVIRREVTAFYTVRHGTGHVTTGWNYRDGAGGVPVRQYCYYSAPNSGDYSSTKTDIALNGMPLPNISASLVPELQWALAKCQWWKDER
jgi:hypothetical protein